MKNRAAEETIDMQNRSRRTFLEVTAIGLGIVVAEAKLGEVTLLAADQEEDKKEKKMTNYVLVHGAWLGAWCWDKVSAQLKASGASVHAEDLPGHGGDNTPVAECTMDRYVDHVAQLVSAQNGPVILVGHSMAGVIISQVAERIPEKISTLIYVSAYLLKPGETILKAGEFASDSHVGPNMILAPDYSTAGIKKEALRDVFCADASDEDASRLERLYRPEPAAPFQFPVSVTAAKWGSVPRAYIRTSQDHTITPAMQTVMLGKTPCDPVLSLHSSHTPFFASANQLSQAILEIGNKVGKKATA